MKKILRFLLNTFVFVLLTAITQIGGVAYLLSLWVSSTKWKQSFKLKTLSLFLSIYLIATFIIVPLIAPFFGRQKITTNENLQPATYFSILLNRNYVKPALNKVLQQLSEHNQISFLDANFPFIDEFPLLPHLSHHDGTKIDLSFMYENKQGQLTNETKSRSGYGIFEAPRGSEFDQISKCKQLGYFQYDYPKHLTFGAINQELRFSASGNRKLITEIVRIAAVEKVFIEPHLAKRLNLNSSKIRYHGCRAVRHDDHIHIQVKK